ncbi:NAD(P)-binding protein [Aaosphaeria arxii CBS 175.79]|uniref:3beta-hydroxysteroid 3-dehydrogenase n=1 Tax=Aaosphaeria arxii CBS 175.79 TaxID=1450172 RepID=A0A6A5XJB7_9PLEO|nr:NAD(P)-binding protein [Aaosphaeria arxii CBS 175.79]KAF2012414.1 NAD(P)-binding protein [Aaosphaeria arxii CBS 175.79]
MGTIIITGANGSLGLAAVHQLFSTHPTSYVILTVRDDSDQDSNTEKLRKIVRDHSQDAHASIRKLDLSSLAAVRQFTATINSEIATKKIPPLATVICNAMSWTINGGIKLSLDGYEQSMAVNHIAHFAMVLQLLGSFDHAEGRIVFLSSDSHQKSALQRYPTVLPADLEYLTHPLPDKEEEVIDRGFQRYGLSKLVIVMTMFEMNRKLRNSKDLKGISALAVDPGALLDSRALNSADIPRMWSIQVYIANIFQPLLRWLDPSLRRCADAAKDVIDLAVGSQYVGQDGYYVMGKKAESSNASRDEGMQRLLWEKSLMWSRIGQEDTVLTL